MNLFNFLGYLLLNLPFILVFFIIAKFDSYKAAVTYFAIAGGALFVLKLGFYLTSI